MKLIQEAGEGGQGAPLGHDRKQLEWELSRDSRYLESNGWYHGSIPRSRAESLLARDGDFLVRDSSTGRPGDVVLSLCWKATHLHFIISKVQSRLDAV